MLILARIQLSGLPKEICRWWETNQLSFLINLTVNGKRNAIIKPWNTQKQFDSFRQVTVEITQ